MTLAYKGFTSDITIDLDEQVIRGTAVKYEDREPPTSLVHRQYNDIKIAWRVGMPVHAGMEYALSNGFGKAADCFKRTVDDYLVSVKMLNDH